MDKQKIIEILESCLGFSCDMQEVTGIEKAADHLVKEFNKINETRDKHAKAWLDLMALAKKWKEEDEQG